MHKIRWGLLSTARINRRVIPAIHESSRGELVAVASRSGSSAEAYARHWQIPSWFSSYDDMLASDEIDAVYISLPNHLHVEWTIRALEAGKHVLCEKPFALTLDGVDQMIAAADRTGKVLAEAFMYRHHPQTKELGEWARSGRLGDVMAFRGTFNFPVGDRNNIRLKPAYGGGSLWDVGIYPMSLAQFLFGGPPETVAAEQWVGSSGVDEFFVGQMRYAGGQVAQIMSSFCTSSYSSAELIGSKGRIHLNRPFVGLDEGRQMMFYPDTGDPEEIPIIEQYLYLGEIQDMHSAILDGKPNYLTLVETRNHVKTLLALYQAAATGRTVTLSDIGAGT